MRYFKKLVIVTFIIIFFFIMFGMVHEFVHSEIMRVNGCSDIKITYNILYMSTECLDINYIMSDTEKLTHLIHEIISYMGVLLVLLHYMLTKIISEYVIENE